jgi:hypothetical protein|tara:strand:- start:1436 stop:2560 length:1125 start_codon:yes stop_codon:yes gene_type:complete
MRKYVVFLFDSSVHHIHHLLGIVSEFSKLHSDFDIQVFVADKLVYKLISKSPYLNGIEVKNITMRLWPWRKNRFGSLAYKYIAKNNFTDLNNAHGLIGASFGMHRLSLFGIDRPKMIYTNHGTGDGEYGFASELKSMDMILVAGEKMRVQIERQSMFRDGLPFKILEVGYPKSDFYNVDIFGNKLKCPKLFDNNKPVLFYNPHWMAELNSFNILGISLIKWIMETDRFNLVVSPHPLFWKFDRKNSKYLRTINNINIHVNEDKLCAADTSLMQVADIYVGDVSSSVYEWLVFDRPILFLNNGVENWESNPHYSMWGFGPVASDVMEMKKILMNLTEIENDFKILRKEAFRRTFKETPVSPSKFAAQSILKFLEQ